MSKSFFRYLRGEINGYYLNNMHNVMEKEIKSIKDFFSVFYNMQFELGKIASETLFNIGKFASIFLPRRALSESLTSLYMTDSVILDGAEHSESGLYNTESEQFTFYILSEDTTEDVNYFSTETERSSLVGNEKIKGYISEYAEDVLDDSGKVRKSVILPSPPGSGAYSEFYGNNFLFLSEGVISYAQLDPSLYIELYKAMQYIRYNGVSIKSLCKIVSVLCPNGLVKIDRLEVSSNKNNIYVYYYYDSGALVSFKEQRITLLEYIINLKFKQIQLVENII